MTSGTRMGRGTSGRARATSVARMAPMMIWPSPPMLMTPVRKAMQMPTPTSMRGMDLRAVAASSSGPPKAPVNKAR